MAFRIALSGLNAASTDLEVAGNNIANASTTGFKQSRAEFGDVFSTQVNDLTATAPGRGVRVTRVAQQFGQGTVDFTSNALDLAINGDGFFVVEDTDGSPSYTRAGAFSSDREGYVTNFANQRLQVYPATTTAGVTTFTTGVLQDLQLPLTGSAPNATTNMLTALNLDGNASQPSVGTFDPTDPDSYNYSTSTTVYDSLGNSHTATYYFVKTATANQWNMYQYVDGSQITLNSGANNFETLTFSTSGAITVPASGSTQFDDLSGIVAGWTGAAQQITVDLSSMTQYGGDYAVNNITQDGYAQGRLNGLDIDQEGVVFARYTNGQSTALGKVALARFNNPQGLRQGGDTQWVETYASGSALYGEAGTSSFGEIQSGALESSNVDLSQQLVNLIIAQRNYQANTKVITTADQITQALINIR